MDARPARRLGLTLLLALCAPLAVAQGIGTGRPTGPDFSASVLREGAAVVSITTTTSTASFSEPGAAPDGIAIPAARERTAREPWARPRRAEHERGRASGFLISADGEIITNAHAVADVDHAAVRLADGRQFSARVIGLDRNSDVALLKIAASGLPVAVIGSSERLTAGEWVVAIGSPFGLDSSVTAGVVSAPRRFLAGSAVPLIQTDVAINPGSSGGPLLNARGEVVGINSMVFSLTGGYMGVSFAVPIDLAMHIAQELRTSGRVSRGQLGAKIQEVSPDLALSFGLPSPSGALVLRVIPGSPAERVGLRGGDIVMGVGTDTAASYAQLQQDVAAARPGQTLALNVWRRGAMQRVALVVGEAPADLPARPERAGLQREDRLGLSLGELSALRRSHFGLDSGLSVFEALGAASRGGILADDVIVAVGDRPVHDVAEFDAALAALPPERPVALLVLRNRVLAYLTVEP